MENKQVDKIDAAELVKKTVIKKKPVVRQTLTSYKRMLKANPLLQLEEAGIKVDDLFKSKTSLHSVSGSVSSISKTSSQLEKKNVSNFKRPEIKLQSIKKPSNDILNVKKPIISGNKPHVANKKLINNLNKNKENSRYVQNKLQQINPNKFVVTSKINSFRTTSNTSSNRVKEAKPVQIHQKNTLRRSLSSDNIHKEKNNLLTQSVSNKKLNHTCSQDNLLGIPQNKHKYFSPIMEEKSLRKSFVFKTPSAHERRSVYLYTPKSTPRPTAYLHASTPFLTDKYGLQERLNRWLKSRGKKLSSYQHLNCFGFDNTNKISPTLEQTEENKENIDILTEKYGSYENLNINVPQMENSKSEKHVSNTDLNKISKEALIELQNLVHEDYPTLQCMGWLELIRDRYKQIVEEPEYWECRAVIEQSAGNVGNAVEYYKTAIIQGAEVNNVEKSLDELLKKFSLLNISPNKSEVTKIDKAKERIIKEARNVFKSTIIQFAIQEKRIKKSTLEVPKTPKLIVTPVRRSTRLSRSGYVSTPGVKLCMSLKEVDNIDNIDVSFEKNKALC
ncbi:hypothetical protein GWI33_021284 [Rhynchophorus ferrugineus]|uniref:Uncharacterized protein n=1 Tax=Rhynchophorus ferrugineus TaxID=354439 RepID=A0A834HQE2_RHYFE|nr:hypothetical protein GWI33_021284 [Rhynchophorus ferrugineus]